MNIFNRPFDDQRQIKIQLETDAILEIFRQIDTGEHVFVWSFILELENSMNPDEFRRIHIASISERAVMTIQRTDSIVERAAMLTSSGLKARDALYLASALHSNCDVLLTSDNAFCRLGKQLVSTLRVMNPVEFVLLHH